MNLKDILTTISNGLYNPDENSDTLMDLFKDDRPTPIGAGLKTYQDNLYYGVADALRLTFPVLESLLTTQNFNYFARKYLLQKKSLNHDIGALSNNFPQYLSEQPQLKDLEWLKDLGMFELYWENLEFNLGQFACKTINPTLSLLDVEHQIVALWQNHEDYFSSNEAPLKASSTIVFWHADGSNYCEEIHPDLKNAIHSIASQNHTSNSSSQLSKPLKIKEKEAIEMLAYLKSKNWIK